MNADIHVVRLELAIRKHIGGNDYVTVKWLSKRLPYSSAELRYPVRKLVDRGELSIEFQNGSSNTYRIWLDEESEGSDEEAKRLEEVTR